MTEYLIYTFAENSTSITNHGNVSGYTGAASSNLYHINSNGNGYPYYGNMSGSSYIAIPGGTENNTILTHSWEMGFYLAGTPPQYAKLWDAACGVFSIQVHNGYIEVVRASASGVTNYWTCATTAMSAGHNYYVCVAISMPANSASTAAANVHVHIYKDDAGPYHQSINWSGAVSSGNWHDSSGTKYLNNYSCSLGTYNFNCAWFIYREFDTAVDWDNACDFGGDKVRWDAPAAKANTACTCTASTTTPLIGANYTVSGRLTRTDTGAGVGSTALNVFWSTNNEGTWSIAYSYVTTDANGNYSYTQTGDASPGEQEYISFPGNGSFNGCNSGVISVIGQAAPVNYNTALSCYVTNANPQDGTTITFYGYLETTGGAAVNSGLITLYLSSTSKGQAYTDSNGYYTISISAVDGTNVYHTGFAQQTIGGSIYYASTSGTISVTGSAAIVDVTVTLTKIGIECAPIAVKFSDIGTPFVIQPECAPINPSVNIGVVPTVVAAECAPCLSDFPPANVYLGILGQFTFCFPPAMQPECAPNSMAVSQLSTEVHPVVTQVEGFTENYCEVDTTATGNTTIIGTECAVMNHYAVIDYPEVLEVDAVLEETLEADALLIDTVHLGVTITKDIELVLEVTTE